ncbi:L10-interacting MYB domain-containing protein [Bienertia sinuspersici]
MSHDRQVSTIRKRTRNDTEDEMELIAIVSGFIMVVVGAWSDRFKHKDLPWNEHERAIKRAYWLDSLMNDRICKEQLRMDRRCFDKLCHVLVTRGGLVITRNVTVLEVVAFFLHTLAHDLKNRTIGAVFTRSGETVSRQFHTVLKVVMKIGKEENLDEENLLYEVDNDLSNVEGVDTVEDEGEDFISTAQASPQWNNFRDEMARKMGYVSWNKQMDDILTRVLLEEINNKEKGDGDFKPQAYQAVVDELKKELGIAINVDHVRNRTKSWKKHYGCIMDIRTYTKFKWDDEKKMIVITMEYLPQWTEYIKENKNAAPYRNKCIENWEDICTLFGADRAVGDGSEQHDEAADVMEGEMVSEGRSSSKDPTNSGSRKRKKDSVAEAVNSFAESFREYVQSKIKDTPRPTCQEIHAVVSQVFGISRSQIMKAVKRFMNGNPDEFLMLKELPEDEKLEWVLLCLAE